MAYRKGQLRIEPGMVTYWAQGKQICDLKPLGYNDMVQAAALNNAHVGEFWVEDGIMIRLTRFDSFWMMDRGAAWKIMHLPNPVRQ